MANTNPPQRQQGVALLIAIIVVALATIIATNMLARHDLDQRRLANMRNSDQAMRYGVAAEQFVSLILKRDFEDNKIDSPDEPWLQPITLPIEEGTLSGQLIDHSGCFNVNNLSSANAEEHYNVLLRLVAALELPSGVLSEQVAQGIRDWVDEGFEASIPYGAEDGHYAGLSPAYRTPNVGMASISELRLVNGLTAADYEKLKPQLCALPSGNTSININMASAELIAALSPDLSASAAQELYNRVRNDAAFESIDQDFMQDPALEGIEIKVNMAVKSEYFLAKAAATIGNTRVSLYSLLFRNEQGQTEVLARSHGTF